MSTATWAQSIRQLNILFAVLGGTATCMAMLASLSMNAKRKPVLHGLLRTVNRNELAKPMGQKLWHILHTSLALGSKLTGTNND